MSFTLQEDFMSKLRLLFFTLMIALAGPLAARAAPTETAVFAGGCFWCMEHDMKGIAGVVSVESGYTGGHVAHPTYEDVTSETSGHYESVRVTFDPAKVDYGFLLHRYWRLIDPTDDGGQFCDRGPSYRPAIFVANPRQRMIAEQSRTEAQGALKGGKIVVAILPLGPFWPAENYHRNFSETNAAHYNAYRQGCGRDARLRAVWGG
jgi:peptide-methionine (S)-S-oxide reductase